MAIAEEKWIALAEVMPMAACRELDQPAYVNVIGLAADKDSFIELIRTECEALDLQLVGVEDIEPWRERIALWQPEAEILFQAESVSNENPFIFGTFVCFEE